MSAVSPARPSGTAPDLERVRATFERAGAYLDGNSTIPVRRRLCHRLVPSSHGARILDLGCGDGSIGLSFQSCASLTLVDVSREMLTRATAAIPPSMIGRVTVVEGPLEHFESKGAYDLVLCLGVLAHVSSVDVAMERLAALTRPGGRIVVQYTSVDSVYGQWVGRHRMTTHGGYAVNRMSDAGIEMAAAAVGLRPLEIYSYSDTAFGLGRVHRDLAIGAKWLSTSRGRSRVFSERVLLLEKPDAHSGDPA